MSLTESLFRIDDLQEQINSLSLGAVTMAMAPEARECYYRIHELYCASINSLEAAYKILNTGNKLAISAEMA